MLYTIIFWAFILIMAYTGYKLIFKGFVRKSNRIVFRKSAVNDFKAYVYDSEQKHNLKDLFKHTGINISVKDYISGRILILIFIAGLCLVCIFSFGFEPLFVVFIYFLLVFVSLPRYTVLGFKTPLALLLSFAKRSYLNSVELELFNILTVLKNLIITCKNAPVSAEYIISNLIEFSKLIKPQLSEFLSLYRLGKADAAFEFFKNDVGTKGGEDFASILIKLDFIEPYGLISQLELYQEAIRDKCLTEKIKKDKLVSDLAFLPVVGVVFLILINFVAISLFLDTITMFRNLFG